MIYAFDQFTLDTNRVELRARDTTIALEPKCFDLLVFLLKNRDRVVTKDEIFEQVWPGVYVSKSSISGAIKQIRQALSDDGQSQKLIRTVRGKGFRFVADTVETDVAPAAAAITADQAKVDRVRDQQGPPVIAVLPFRLIQTDETHSAIAEGIPTELISALSRFRAMHVIARASSFRFDPMSIDYSEVRSRLGADYALSGAVELAGATLIISTELTHLGSQRVLWSETTTSALDDVFSVRQTIVHEVCNAVELRVPMNEADLSAKVPSENLDAWGHYHLGVRHLFRFNQADNHLAQQHMKRAVELDPDFARAFAGLSYAEFENYNLNFGSEKAEHRSLALSLAEKATDLDPLDPFCNLVLGRAKWIHQEIDEALGWIERSLKLNPNYAFGHYNCSKFNAILCSGAVADEHAVAALSLSPLDPHLQSMLSARALAAFVRNDLEQAVGYANMSLRAPNPHLYVRAIAAAILEAHGNHGEAEAVARSISGSGNAFDGPHFWSLFKLRDDQRNDTMAEALHKLGFA